MQTKTTAITHWDRFPSHNLSVPDVCDELLASLDYKSVKRYIDTERAASFSPTARDLQKVVVNRAVIGSSLWACFSSCLHTCLAWWNELIEWDTSLVCSWVGDLKKPRQRVGQGQRCPCGVELSCDERKTEVIYWLADACADIFRWRRRTTIHSKRAS